jgi:hypothetical protein
LSNDTWVTLTLATNNSLREFWYGIPTRITLSGQSTPYEAVIPETAVGSLSSVTPSSIGNPGRLWITLNGNDSAVQRYKGRINRASVQLEGIDVFGKELKEKVIFTYNGKVKTKREWGEVDVISTEYIDDDATIRVDWLPIGNQDHIDPMNLNISENREKFRFFSTGSFSGGATLQSKSFAADDFYTVQQGNDLKDTFYEVELLNDKGRSAAAIFSAVWPYRFWIVTTDGAALHFYYPDPSLGDKTPLAERTTECILQIETEFEHALRGDTVSLDTNLTRPFWRILRTRWSVKKPDGTRVGIAPDGSEIAYSSSGWVTNDAGVRYRKLGYEAAAIDYTLDLRGQYTFYLETMIKDNLNPGNQDPIFQTDIKIIMAEGNQALSSINLPNSVGTVNYFAFDGYGQPWVVNTSNTAFRLNFHYDYYLVDFNDKHVLVREDFQQVSVTA